MTQHLYQAQILHYLTAQDIETLSACKRCSNAIPPTTDHSSTVLTDIPILSLPGGDTGHVYPEYIADGALIVDDVSGRVVDYGTRATMMALYAKTRASETSSSLVIHDCQDKLIMPGFIDTHVHYPQVDMMAAYGEQLLDWLNNYTFVTEANFADANVAHDTAQFFLNQLLAHGTTSAMVFSTSHPLSAEAFFIESQRLNTRMITGNVLMDRHAPKHLCVPAKQSIQDTQDLIERWHEKGRQHVAITPRFAITSTPEQLHLAGELYASYERLYLQTHLAENRDEVAAVRKLYPKHDGYLDVYADMGLLGRYTTLAHGIYLDTDEYHKLRDTGTQIAHCPTSNLFLGSGLFDLPKTLSYTGVSIATDVGAGTSLSMLTTLSEAYKVQQLQGNRLSAHQGLYQITLGNAQSLLLDQHVGNFMPGKEADFVVIDMAATPLLTRRMAYAHTLDDRLFVLMMLGDDRVIDQTMVAGTCRYTKNHASLGTD